MAIAEQVKDFFHKEGIHSTTIQPEFIDVCIDRKMVNSFD
jgi:zinc transporter 1